jgi:hypothetical protein
MSFPWRNLSIAAAGALVMAGSAQAVNLVVNGSFEAVPFTSNGNYTLGLTDADVPGWHIPASNGTYPWGLQTGAFGAPAPADGDQWVVLGLHSPRTEFSIEQTLTGLSNGATYSLKFAIASEWNCCSQARVSFVGSATAPQDFTAPTSGQYWTEWGYHGMNFVASASSVTITITNINPTTGEGYDLGLDDVTVSAVPEPATYALLIAGLAGVGAVARRRREG